MVSGIVLVVGMLVYLLVFHAYINEMHGSRSKIPIKKSRPYIYMMLNFWLY
jgi:hypothetical protein